MSERYKRLKKAVDYIRKETDFIPDVALVLGSGLGGFSEKINVVKEIPYKDLPDFPVSTVAGHDGKYILGYVGDTKVIAMKGRVHYYEGYEMFDVVMPVRIMGLLGAKSLLLTNAAGSININNKPGDLMMIEDHIGAFIPNPLRGENLDELGPRFPDMSKVYNRDLQTLILQSAKEVNIDIKKGVYVQWPGPTYETPTEIKMFRTLGADAVGMSTVCEAIAANHMGLKVAGISCLTNMAAGILDQPLSHEEVQECADRVKDKFELLMETIIKNIK